MSEESVNGYPDTCRALEQAIRDLDTRIRISEQNTKLRENYQAEIDKANHSVAIASTLIDLLKPMCADIETYITERKKESMQNINHAIRIAGEIIQDATEGIYFHLDGDEAWLSTPDGLEVDMVEGGGYRQISSTFLRSVVLGANPDTLNTLFLDEIFSLVSQQNSASLSLYLNVICNDMQVISIEQKPQVYSNIDSRTYTFNKLNNFAEVTVEEIKRGGNGNEVPSEGISQH